MEGGGLPVALHLESGKVHDLKAALPTLQALVVPRPRGRARTRPLGLAADKGYDSRALRRHLSARGIAHAIPTKRTARRKGRLNRELYAHRWKVERFFAWLNGCRRLHVRLEYHDHLHLALLHLAAIRLCLNRLLQ